MASLLNSAVMTGLMRGASHAGMNRLATRVYTIATGRGDEGAAERAMGYAGQYRGKALTTVQQTREALAERVGEMREEERIERDQRLAQQRVERCSGAEAAPETDCAAAYSTPRPAAVFEPSQEYLDHVQAEAGRAEAAVRPAGTVTPSVPEGGAFSSNRQNRIAGMKTVGTAGHSGFSMDIRV